MIRFPNRTAQAGVYHTGSPNYVDVSSGAAETSMVTFTAKETDDSWADDDIMAIVIFVDSSNYKVWTASWDATNKYLEVVTEEESVGSISDSTSVTVTAVMSTGLMTRSIFQPQLITVTGTSYTLSSIDLGATIRFTNGSAVTVTVPATLPVDFHCLCVQEGAGTVSLDPQSTDTINGATDTVDIADQWQAAYLYQGTEGAWTALI